MGLGVGTVSGHNSGSSSGIPSIVANLFQLWEFSFSENVPIILFLEFDALRGNGSQFGCTEMAFVHFEFKAYVLDAYETCSQVGDKVVRIIGCNLTPVTM